MKSYIYMMAFLFVICNCVYFSVQTNCRADENDIKLSNESLFPSKEGKNDGSDIIQNENTIQNMEDIKERHKQAEARRKQVEARKKAAEQLRKKMEQTEPKEKEKSRSSRRKRRGKLSNFDLKPLN